MHAHIHCSYQWLTTLMALFASSPLLNCITLTNKFVDLTFNAPAVQQIA
jgi:hypothetical protein